MKISNLVIAIFYTLALISCSNDDNNTETCTTQGLFYTLGNNTIISATEADLTTDLFPNNTVVNGQSVPSVEIFGNDSNGDFIVFVTEVLTINSSGSANIIIGSGASEVISVTCLATDTVVGGLMRFKFSGSYNNNTISGEYCVTIDSVNP